MTALILISTIPVLGQNHIIGVKGGINLTNIYSNKNISNSHYRTGFNGGLTYEYILNNRFGLGVDLLYSQKGFTNNVFPAGIKATYIFNYDYLSFPIKGGFFIGDNISGFVNLGLVPSILIDAKEINPAVEGFVDEKTTIDVTDKVTKFDFGGLIEIGGSYKFGNHFFIFTLFAYQQSFTTITNADYLSQFKIKHYSMTVSIGLKYILKKE